MLQSQNSQLAPSSQHRTTCSPNLQYYTEKMMLFVLARAGRPPSSIRQQRLQTAHLGPPPSPLRSVRCAQMGCSRPQGHGWDGLRRTWSRCGSVQEESWFVPCRIRGWSVRRVLKAGVVAVELLLFPRSSLVPPVLGPGTTVVLMVPPRARKLYVELCCLGAVLLTSFWVPVWMRLPVLWLCGRVARMLSVASALLIRLASGWFCVA